LGAWQTLRAAREQELALDEQAVDRVTQQLSRVLLQRQRADVADQLPAVILGQRVVAMGEAQREAHDRAKVQADRLLAGWQRSGWMADADQWRLSQCLVAMQHAAHRADPLRADSPLAQAVVQALSGQLDDWAEDAAAAADGDGAETAADSGPAAGAVWLLCGSAADAAQLAEALGPRTGLHLVPPGPLPAGTPLKVLQVGVPWRLPVLLSGGREDAARPTGQQRTMVVADGSIDIGLLDTLAGRSDTPSGPAEPKGRGFLVGERLTAWLRALAQALHST
jgi:hypothetical protein